MTEFELIKGCIKQQANCQRMLYEQYAGKLMAVCLRYAKDAMEAEDMLQDAFVRIFNYINQFKFEGSFEGWMRRITVNVALKYLQKKKLQFAEVNEQQATEAQVPAMAYSHLGEEILMQLIQQLPTGYKIVFNLNVIEGYSHEEIADMLNIKASTSRSQLVKARKILQEQIIQLQKIAV
ncbi:MAG: RNA polymerase sigma factor [Bacteroidota bacterium]|nr:RNA polymerase sigma factor [Bacteroidota bacterium]